jgi:hypothetical protein
VISIYHGVQLHAPLDRPHQHLVEFVIHQLSFTPQHHSLRPTPTCATVTRIYHGVQLHAPLDRPDQHLVEFVITHHHQ